MLNEMEHSEARTLFRSAVDKRRDWEEAAIEDYKFRSGEQWTEADRAKLTAEGRPPVTINITKAYTSILSGYQRLNRYDAKFNPRSKEDADGAKIREAVTKFVFDQAEYDMTEAATFLHCITGGVGVFDTGYRVQNGTLDGDIYIDAGSPFDYYPDPDTRKADWSDSRWIAKAWWVDKDTLAMTYPEQKDEIENAWFEYDQDETLGSNLSMYGPVWWDRTTKKARLIELWYKVFGSQTFYKLANGQVIKKEEADNNALLYVASSATVPSEEIRVKVMLGNLELEDKPSPYEHGCLPFVPVPCDSLQEVEALPAGIVRDMKDMQRSINKQHSQQLHLINTMAGRLWLVPAGDKQAQRDIEENGARPNGQVRFTTQEPNTVDRPSIDQGLAQIEAQSLNYVESITGINKPLMGMTSPTATSGRAKEIDQKQAITAIAPLFDNLRSAKKRLISDILWGSKNKRGLIPQYFRDEKVIRIVGEDGQADYITINKQMQIPMPFGGYIHQVINDISIGEYDVFISDTPATPTQRQAQFWALMDAVKNLGLPGEMIFDILLDASDLPQREQIKERWLERQQQMGAKKPDPPKLNLNLDLSKVPQDIQPVLNQYGVAVPAVNPLAAALGGLPPPTGPQAPPPNMPGRPMPMTTNQQIMSM